MIRKLINWIDNYFSKNELNLIDKLIIQIDDLNTHIKNKDLHIGLIEKHYEALLLQLEKKEEKEGLEEYWNNKISKNNSYRFPARTLLNKDIKLSVDPRVFFNPIDNSLPIISGKNTDTIAYNCLNYVRRKIKYTSDVSQFKHTEEWLFPYETLKLRKGDCEDGAILMANMMIKSGIPYYRVRLNAGSVKGGGHAYVTYLREKDNKWIILDWCYWYRPKGRLWKTAKKYFGIWFSFNTKYVFIKSKLDRE